MAITRQIAVINNSEEFTEREPTAVSGGRLLAADTGYHEVLDHMQQGNWQQATPMLRLLQAQYPGSPELDMLLQEVALRSEYEESWGDKVKGRRTSFSVGRFASRVVPVILVAILFAGGLFYFNRLRSLNELASQRQALMEQAQSALQAGLYENAISFFDQLLKNEPENAMAQRGKSEAETQIELLAEYNLGIDAMAAGDVAAALNYFKALQEHAPGYRDVTQRIAEVETIFETEEIFAAGETAYQNGKWTEAIKQYEALRLQDSTYEAATVTTHLIGAYVGAGQEIIAQNPEQGADPELAEQYFSKALKLKTGEPTATVEADVLEDYFAGMQAFRRADYAQVESLLRPIYDERPTYLGGYLAQFLYDSYLELGDSALQKADHKTALSYYNQATEIHVSDASAALMGAYRAAAALTPTPTPTFTPTVTPTPAPTATPKPLPVEAYKGWILFRSDRNGGESFFIMRSDGSDVRLAPYDAAKKIDEMYRQAAWSPDGTSQLYVKKEREDADGVNIYKLRHDLPENWRRRFDMALFDRAQYDPVWDPSNNWIAFVSNHTGNDEIWLMDTEGQHHKQLTFNTWEWDKHPSWSLDGRQIAFFTNRTGPKQIWIMNADGSGQVNISNNKFNDWDPVFITGKPVPLPEN